MSTPADAAAGAVVQVKTSDGAIVKLPIEIAKQLNPIGGGATLTWMTISLPEVHSADLAKAVKYCEKHNAGGDDDEGVRSWDKELVGGLEGEGLHDLMMAARFLGLEGLLGLACQELTNRIARKDAEQVRAMFNFNSMPSEVPWPFRFRH